MQNVFKNHLLSFFFLKSTDISEFIMASCDYLMPADETSLSSNYEPIELFQKSDDFCDYCIFLNPILDPFSSNFFFFFTMLESPSDALEIDYYPSTESEASYTLYVFIGFKVDPFGSLFISILTSESNLLSSFYIAEVTETLSLMLFISFNYY